MRINSEAAAGKMKHKAKQPFSEETYKDKKNEDIDDNVIPSLTTGFLGVRKDAKKHGKREGTLKLKEKDNIGLGEEGKLLNDEKVSKEMDDLLACYLTLNAYEYHDLIIKVFWQVWSDMRQGGLVYSQETQLMVGLGKEFNGGVGMLCAHSWNE
ncbi:hypothetical protein JHK85_027790 [Glycine max]|nr:hypothetical protein JHK85_027790 [Glycine max]KAG5003149.1 hypothetical protein JHK86_027288 [Glycine max]